MNQPSPTAKHPPPKPTEQDGKPGARAEPPIDLASESVAGEEDPGAALTQEPVGTPAPKLPGRREH